MFRLIMLVVLIGCGSVSGYHRRRARQQKETIARSREGGWMMAFRLVVALPLFLGVLTTIVMPGWMSWAELPLPAWLRWVGAGLGILAIPSVAWTLGSLGANVSETVLTKKDHELVTIGPYRWIRHPLYTTGIVMFVGLGLMSASGFILAITLVTVVAVRLVVIPREERALEAKFGQQYADLRQRTGALLPRL
jgi:protein-S-isoprenylcysteine O-methyltransferase Ste14